MISFRLNLQSTDDLPEGQIFAQKTCGTDVVACSVRGVRYKEHIQTSRNNGNMTFPGCIPVFQSQMDIAGVHPDLQNRISVLRNDSQRKPWKLQSWKCSTDDCGGASNATFPTFGGFSISDRRIFTKSHSLFQNQGNVCVLLRQICCLKQTRELRQRYSASFWNFEANDFGSTYIYPYGIRRRVSAGDISWLFFPRWSASHLFHGSSVQLNGLKPAAEITILRRPKVWCVLRRAGSTCFRGNVHLFLHHVKFGFTIRIEICAVSIQLKPRFCFSF